MKLEARKKIIAGGIPVGDRVGTRHAFQPNSELQTDRLATTAQ